MGTKDYFKEEEVLRAIKGSFGIMDLIAKKLKCTWTTAERYVSMWKSTRAAFQEEKEVFLDLAETKAMRAIKAGSEQMIRYYLSTQGKKRGYIEAKQQEIGGIGGKPIEFTNVDSLKAAIIKKFLSNEEAGHKKDE